MLCALIGCSPNQESNTNCIHKSVREVKENIVNATCIANGSYDLVKYCDDCGEMIGSEHIDVDALGHDLVHHDGKSATCTEKGYEAYDTCSRCDYSTYQEIPALGHDMTKHAAVEATEENDGNKEYYTCSREAGKYYLLVNNEYIEANYDTDIKLNKLDHTHTYVHHDAATATCATDGNIEYYECSGCHKYFNSSKEEISSNDIVVLSLGHDLVHHDGKAATCTEIGWEAYDTCSRCDYSTYQEIPALGHDLVHHDGKSATCTEIGWEAYDTCSRCDHSTYQEIPALGHDLVHHNGKSATCTEKGYEAYDTCSRCDYSTFIKEIKTHQFLGPNYTCVNCGRNMFETLNGSYGYSYLNDHFNNPQMAQLYDFMLEECISFFLSKEDLNTSIIMEININDYSLTFEQVLTVYKLLNMDCPMFYAIDGMIIIDEQTIGLIIDDAYRTSSVRKECNNNIVQALEEVLNIQFNKETDFYTSLLLHDYIIDSIDYKYDDNGVPANDKEAHSIIGTFSKRGGVCEAYARAFQVLLNFYNIENIIVGGEAGELHVWNLVKLEDEWYLYDLTWDEHNRWEDGNGKYYFDYNYYWTARSAEFYKDSHFITDDSKELGINYQYELPEIAINDYSYDHEWLIGQEFTIDDITYVVIGANKVEIKWVDKKGDVILPETVINNGTKYTCVSIGNSHDYGIFYPALSIDVKNVTIPKTIEYIWENALTGCPEYRFCGNYTYTTLENIYVDEENPFYTSIDGVLFTKSLLTLVAYPPGNSRSVYHVPNSTVSIADFAFGYKNNLHELYLGQNIENVGIRYPNNNGKMNWDYFPIIVNSDFVMLNESMAEKAKVFIDENNRHYYSDNYAIYSLGYKNPDMTGLVASILYIFPSNNNTFTIMQTVNAHGEEWDIWNLHTSAFYKYHQTNLFEGIDNINIENEYFSLKDGLLYLRDMYNRFGPIAVVSSETHVEVLNGSETTNGFFMNNDYVEEVVLPVSIKELDGDFSGANRLTTVYLTNSITRIGFYSFVSCANLSDIYYDGTLEEWNLIELVDGWDYDTGNYVIHCTNGDILKDELH